MRYTTGATPCERYHDAVRGEWWAKRDDLAYDDGDGASGSKHAYPVDTQNGEVTDNGR